MSKTQAVMLSTSDNPWDPWTSFKEWNTWDMQHGYHTLAYLSRITASNEELSDQDQDLALRQAIDEILEINLTGNYVAVVEPESSKVS
jgi:hypothetical protein